MTWLGFVLVRRMYTTKKAKRAKDLTMTVCAFSWLQGVGILSGQTPYSADADSSEVRCAMALRRLCLAALFLALTASIANAYTIVLRDGRRVEIPNQFTLTDTTLTYEVGSGVQITIQVASINIAATEWTNGEQPGSFLRRGVTAPQQQVAPATSKRSIAGRSITNKDLETFRQKRIQSEMAYEKRRRELGLPSAAEARRESAAIGERTREQLSNMRSKEQEAEEYWRGRASSLRTEIAANQAQIDFVRRRLDEIPLTNSLGGFSTLSPFGAPALNYPFQGLATPNVFQQSYSLGQRRFPYGNNRGRFNRGRSSPFYGNNLIAYPSFQTPDYSYERAELVNQLNELEMTRTGFIVRWRELEEEARRAGAYPGWLRP
jgi:hypothetical protein